MCASVDSPWGLGIGEVPLIRDRGKKGDGSRSRDDWGWGKKKKESPRPLIKVIGLEKQNSFVFVLETV